MHKNLIVMATFLALAATSAPASAKWGCYAQNAAGNKGVSWADSTEKAARAEALFNCKKFGSNTCRTVSCKANVDTQDQVQALWGGSGTVVCKTNCAAK
jgi:hypothetical protein